MPDFLQTITVEVRKLLHSGYYTVRRENTSTATSSLKEAVQRSRGHAVIAEIKPATPLRGRLKQELNIGKYVNSAEQAGVVGFSVLTQPRHFEGSLDNLSEARRYTSLPILMKDFIIAREQVDAAFRSGADAVLLIQSIFVSRLSVDDEESLISQAHTCGLEVLTEVNNEDELIAATSTGADMIGINHRNLKTLEMDLTLTKKLMRHCSLRDKVVVAESGIAGPEDARKYFKLGVDAILVGSYLMEASDALKAARLLVEANE